MELQLRFLSQFWNVRDALGEVNHVRGIVAFFGLELLVEEQVRVLVEFGKGGSTERGLAVIASIIRLGSLVPNSLLALGVLGL